MRSRSSPQKASNGRRSLRRCSCSRGNWDCACLRHCSSGMARSPRWLEFHSAYVGERSCGLSCGDTRTCRPFMPSSCPPPRELPSASSWRPCCVATHASIGSRVARLRDDGLNFAFSRLIFSGEKSQPHKLEPESGCAARGRRLQSHPNGSSAPSHPAWCTLRKWSNASCRPMQPFRTRCSIGAFSPGARRVEAEQSATHPPRQDFCRLHRSNSRGIKPGRSLRRRACRRRRGRNK